MVTNNERYNLTNYGDWGRYSRSGMCNAHLWFNNTCIPIKNCTFHMSESPKELRSVPNIKVNMPTPQKVFGNLAVGDPFIYNGEAHIKCRVNQAIKLGTQGVPIFGMSCIVEPCELEINVRR